MGKCGKWGVYCTIRGNDTTSTGGMLPSDWVLRRHMRMTQTTAKTSTAEQLEVIWGNAEHKLRMDNGSFLCKSI